MTRDVEDAALLFNAMQGFDPQDAQTLPHSQVDALKELKTGIAGMRFVVLPDTEIGELDPGVAAAYARALDVLRGLGARIDTLKLPLSYKRLAEIVGKIIAAEGYALHRDWIDRDDLPFDRDVRDRIRWAKGLSAADYIQVMAERKSMQREIDALLRDYAALLMPTTPLAAVPLTAVDQGKAPMSLLTRPINLLDMCALALPCGFTADGLPVSLQIAGRGYDEARILRIGWAYEKQPSGTAGGRPRPERPRPKRVNTVKSPAHPRFNPGPHHESSRARRAVREPARARRRRGGALRPAAAVGLGRRRHTDFISRIRPRDAAMRERVKRAGVGPGTHVAVMLPNVPAYVVTWMALARLGAVMVPVNTQYKPRELEYVLQDSATTFLVIDAGCLTVFDAMENRDALVPPSQLIVHGTLGANRAHDWQSIVDAAARLRCKYRRRRPTR